MTLAQFSEIFALLAVQLRQTDADEATIRAYFEALKDLEPEFLAFAAHKLARSSDWFPKTSEWRDAAMAVEKQRTDELKARLRNLRERLCLACDDTGWAKREDGRVHRCGCVTLRRLEILGRRPMPELPEASEPEEHQPSLERVHAMIAGRVKAMP